MSPSRRMGTEEQVRPHSGVLRSLTKNGILPCVTTRTSHRKTKPGGFLFYEAPERVKLTEGNRVGVGAGEGE